MIILDKIMAMKMWYHHYEMMKGCLKRECSERAMACNNVKNAMYHKGVEQEGRAKRRVEYCTKNMARVDGASG